MLKVIVALIVIVAVAAGVGFYVMTGQRAPAPATATTSSTTLASTPSTTSTSTTSSTTTSVSTTQPGATSTTQQTTSTTSSPSTTSTTSTNTHTSTTSSTTTTTLTTSSTTSTSTTTSTTSTTLTTTTTTTPAQEIDAKALTIETILKNYEKITLNIYYMNKTTSKETNTTVAMAQEPGGSVGGVNTVKVVFSVNGNEQANLTLWMSKDYSTVVKLDINGQTLEGQLANLYGQQLLRRASAILMPYAYVGDIRLKIAGDTATAIKTGWEVTSVTPTTATISGHSYKAYSVTVRNVADTDNVVSDVKLTVAEISPNVWILTYMRINMKDGSAFTGQILELVPKT